MSLYNDLCIQCGHYNKVTIYDGFVYCFCRYGHGLNKINVMYVYENGRFMCNWQTTQIHKVQVLFTIKK